MSRAPNGVPTISYCRILPAVNAFGPADIATDGNAIVVHEGGQPPLRFEVAQVIDKTISDEEACELTFGNRAGVGLGAPLNPVSAFVNDAANVVVLLTGSKMTKKWQFLKRTFLPFLANEMINTISERSQDPSVNNYKAQLTLSSFEIQDEIISDLLRPANRGLSISTTLEEGVMVQGLHRETVVDEMTLRKLLVDACDNRAVQSLPVGGSIDTSSGIFEFRLYQSDSGNNNMVGNAVYQSRECYSRLVVVDVPSVDPLLASTAEEMRLLAGPTLNKSLYTFMDVAKKLNNPYRAQIAPFRSAKLPHFLSELLGGNAIVVAMGQVIPGEAACSKRTMEMLAALNSAIHYPMGARELSDSLRGLLGKYRAMMMHMQDEMNHQLHHHEEHVEQDKATAKMVEKLQRELAQAITEKTAAIEDRNRIFEMTELLKAKYNTVMEEKLKQSEQLAQVEEDNIALARTIVELNLKIATEEEQHEKTKFEWNVQILQRDTKLTALEEEIKQLHETIENQKDDLAEKSQLIAGNNKVIAELKDQVDTKSYQLNEQKEKNVELGAELLTLVNHKEVLQQEFDAMKIKFDLLTAAQEKENSKEERLTEDVRKLLEKLVSKDEEISELRKLLMDANESVTHLQYEVSDIKRESEAKELTHLEKEKHLEEEQEEIRLEAEKLAAELAAKEAAPPVIVEVVKEVPAPVPSTEAAAPVEPEKPKTPPPRAKTPLPPVQVVPKKDPNEVVRRAVDVMKLEAQDKKEKVFLRKQFDLEKQLHRLTNDFTNEKHVNVDLDKELKSLQGKYKDALRSSLLLPSSAESKPDLGAIPTDHALLSLLSNYEQREDILQRRNEALFQSRSDIIAAYRALYDHYKSAVETMEDMTTILTDPRYKSNDKKMGIDLKLKALVENALQEQYTFSLAQLSASENQIHDIQQNERQDNYEDRKSSSQYEIESKERIAAIISTYQHQLQQKEENLAQLQQQYINLQVQTKQLISQQTLNPAALKKEYAAHQDKMLKEELDNSAQHYQNLCTEIQELRKQLMSKDISANQVTSRKPSAHLIQVLKDVVASSTPVPSTPNKVDSKPSGDVDSSDRMASPASLFPSPPPPTKASKSKEHEELRTQLIAAETRAADLVSKQVSLQEELHSYQTYMKEIIPQYQKQIAQLQAQVLKKKAAAKKTSDVSKEVPKIENHVEKEVEELKLPPIV